MELADEAGKTAETGGSKPLNWENRANGVTATRRELMSSDTCQRFIHKRPQAAPSRVVTMCDRRDKGWLRRRLPRDRCWRGVGDHAAAAPRDCRLRS